MLNAKELYREFCSGDLTDKLLDALILLTIITVAYFIFLGAYYLIDIVGTKDKTVNAQGISRKYSPAWVQTTYIMVNKAMVPNIIHHPEKWSIRIVTENNNHISCRCTKEMYSSFTDHMELIATVYSGRLSNDTYCKNITKGN